MSLSRPSSRVPKNHPLFKQYQENKQDTKIVPAEKNPHLKKALREFYPPLSHITKKKASESLKNETKESPRIAFAKC